MRLRRVAVASLGAMAVTVPAILLGLTSYSAKASTPAPIPSGMPAPGTYSLTYLSSSSADQSTAPTLSVTDGDQYLQSWNLPPDNIQLALSADPDVSGAVDLNSIYINGVTFFPQCGTSCLSNFYDILYRPPNLAGITVPYSWGTTFYESDPGDPSNPQSGVLGISYTAYPPTINYRSDGSTETIQEIVSTFTFQPGYSIGGSYTQTHYQIVNNPAASTDFFDGNLTTTSGSRHIGEQVNLGPAFLDGF